MFAHGQCLGTIFIAFVAIVAMAFSTVICLWSFSIVSMV